MQNPSAEFFQMFGVQAVPPLPAPHCAKKGPFVKLAGDKKRAHGGVFYKKDKQQQQTGAVLALGELPYAPKQDAWSKPIAKIIIIITLPIIVSLLVTSWW